MVSPMGYFADLMAEGRCPSCAGTGKVWRLGREDQDCSTCWGDGRWPPQEWRIIEGIDDYDRFATAADDTFTEED
jgi:DnaJ-class molecular chaperone